MNPLATNPAARSAIYTAFWAISLILGAIQIAYNAVNVADPTWLIIALAVYPFIAAATGYTASRNTPAPPAAAAPSGPAAAPAMSPKPAGPWPLTDTKPMAGDTP